MGLGGWLRGTRVSPVSSNFMKEKNPKKSRKPVVPKRDLTDEEEHFAQALAVARDVVRAMGDEMEGGPSVKGVHNEDQLEGRLVDVMRGLKGYAHEGMMVVRSGSNDRWKVVVFGGGKPDITLQTLLIMRCIVAGLVALEKIEDVDNLSLD